MRPSKDDAVPAKITEDGTPTIFSFLTSMDSMESRAGSAAKELQTSFESISLSGPESGEITGAAACCSNNALTGLGCVLWTSDADVAAAGDAGGGQDDGGQEADDMFDLDDL